MAVPVVSFAAKINHTDAVQTRDSHIFLNRSYAGNFLMNVPVSASCLLLASYMDHDPLDVDNRINVAFVFVPWWFLEVMLLFTTITLLFDAYQLEIR